MTHKTDVGAVAAPPTGILNVRAKVAFVGSASESRDIRGRDGRLSQHASLEPSELSLMGRRKVFKGVEACSVECMGNDSHRLCCWLSRFRNLQLSHLCLPSHSGHAWCVPEPPVYHDGLPPSSIMPFKHDCCTNSSGQDSCSASFHAENAPTAVGCRVKARRTASSMSSRLASLVAGSFDRTG